MMINVGADDQGNAILRNLLTHYGEITLTQVRADAALDYIGQENRNAQVSHMMHQCLIVSISTDVAERMVTEKANYLIDETPDGPSYLMTLIQVYFVNTEATPTQIRLQIADAPQLIAEVKFDIDTFNTTMNSYIQKLSSLGHETQDLFAHLVKGYKLVPDKNFERYMSTKIDAHNDGSARLTAQGLMSAAKAKFDTMNESKEWMAKDSSEEQIVALAAQLEQVRLTLNQAQKGNKGKGKNGKKGKGKDSSSSAKDSKSQSKKSDDKWAWKDVPPKANETIKHFDGKDYHWCKHHNKWCVHKESECRLKDKQAASPAPAAAPSKAQFQAKPAVFDDGAFAGL